MADRSLTRVQGGTTDTIHINTDKFAGVRTMSKTGGTVPLTDATTSIQVTVPLKPEFNGVYNTTAPVTANSTWTKVGGGVTITACNYNGTDAYDYAIGDSETWGCFDGVSGTDRPWKVPTALWTITGLPLTETVTVDRAAQVIDSDRKGESRPLLSKVVGGAAAAYSLRDLNDRAGNNKVVRVRRASDNNERDFLAKEVSNGTLKNWVNTQTVLPLDIQALTDDGRTGSLIPAKAAYSLRNLSKNYTGNVVDVRRSSDDTEQGFTAAQVTDGTLLAWVNEDVTIYQSDYSVNANGWSGTTSSPTGNQDGVSDSAGTSKDNVLKLVKQVDSQGYMNGNQGVVAGLTYTVSGSFLAPASNTAVDGLLIKDGTSGGISANYPSGYLISDGTWKDFSFSYTATVSGLQRVNFGISSLGANPNGSSTGSSGDIVYIADLKFVETTSDGHVSKWYDQSGEDNHAVQATPASQPKIVNAGSLNTSGGLEFDGSNDFFSLTSSFSFLNKAGCVFSLQDGQSSSNDFTLGNSSSNRGIGFRNIQTRWYYTGGPIDIDHSISISGETLFTALHDGTTNNPNVTAFVNSSLIVDGSPDSNQGEANVSTGVNQIGGRRNLSFLAGTVKEIIIYDTDQTDNRTAIEANIGEAYSLTGIPAYDNTVDGFVETWYDQSGNSNDAVQATAGSQPKIVSAGSFLNELDFDGTDDNFELTSVLGMTSAGSIFTVAESGGGSDKIILDNRDSGVDGFRLFRLSNDLEYRWQSATVDTGTNLGTNTKFLGFANHDGSNASAAVNGATATTTSDTSSISVVAKAHIGARSFSSASNFWDGTINELIIYNSDQTANRPAIEANINNQYDIY